MFASLRKNLARARRWLIALPLTALGICMVALMLVGCGGSSNPTNILPSGKYAYLYSSVDYPLQIAANGADTVTLTLSPNSNLVSAAPGQGHGKTTDEPIPLPTDLSAYRDIAAAAEASGGGPLVWQLTSAPRQSLLTPATAGVARRYVDAVTFTWHVQAIAAGDNTAKIYLHLYYVYLSGQSRSGAVVLTPTAVPIVAVASNPLMTWLAGIKLPFVSLTSLAGIIGLFRFVQGIVQTANDTVETVKKTVEVAGKVHQHFHPAPHTDALPPTIKRSDHQ